jgi:hypothetical protein
MADTPPDSPSPHQFLNKYGALFGKEDGPELAKVKEELGKKKKDFEAKDKEFKALDKKFKEQSSDLAAAIGLIVLLVILQFFPANWAAFTFVIGIFVVLPAWGIYKGWKKLQKKYTDKPTPQLFNIFAATALGIGIILGTIVTVSAVNRATDASPAASPAPATQTNSRSPLGVYIYVAGAFQQRFAYWLDLGRGTRSCPDCTASKPTETPPRKVETPPPVAEPVAPEPTAEPEIVDAAVPSCGRCDQVICRDECVPEDFARLPYCAPGTPTDKCPVPRITTDGPLQKSPPRVLYDLNKLPDHSRYIAPCNARDRSGC